MVQVRYERFLLTECVRCGNHALRGMVAGLRFLVNTTTVPARDAAVLKRYDVPVLLLEIYETGVWADFWSPATHDLASPGRHLVIPHVCRRTQRRLG